MDFSVLMSVYSKENPKFLQEAIESITISQTLQPSEIILIEDGPLPQELTATIQRLVEQYPIIRVYSLPENIGLGKALNYGLTKCQYDWVARMDSDDIAAQDRFEKQVAYIKEHPEVVVLGSHITEFNQEPSDAQQMRKVPLSHDEIQKMATSRNPMNHMTVFLRKDCITELGSYHHVPYVEDYELWLRVLAAGYQMANIDDYLVYARIGNGMAYRRSNRIYISSWRTINQFMLEKQMIRPHQFVKNMIAIRGFIYTPVAIKEFIYKAILRK